MARRLSSRQTFWILCAAFALIVVLFLIGLFFLLRHFLWNGEPVIPDDGKTFTVVFENADGSEISIRSYREGETVEIPADPSFGPDAQYTYSFRGWSETVETVATRDRKYTAVYDTALNAYRIVFVNYDGQELNTQVVVYGSNFLYAGVTPRRPSDVRYQYTFSGWEKTPAEVWGELLFWSADPIRIRACYTETLRQYTVRYCYEDGTPYREIRLPYGSNGTDACPPPAKEPTEQYTYSFAGWDGPLSFIEGDTTVRATYTSALREYTILFADRDSRIVSSAVYHYGDTVTAPEMEVFRPEWGYFAGWDRPVGTVTGSATYTAVYAEEQPFFDVCVEYRFEDGTAAAPTFTARVPCGDSYSVVSPELPYFTASESVVSGRAFGDAMHVVTYVPHYSFRRDAEGYCIIDSADLLFVLSRVPSLWSERYCLASTISMEGKLWSGIGTAETPFSGIFDGRGFSVTDVTYSPGTVSGLNQAMGFFNVVSGTVRNLRVSGMQTDVTSDRILHVGGLVGNLTGRLENCSFSGELHLTTSRSVYFGGLVGYLGAGTLFGCNATFGVTASANGAVYLGGIAGYAVNSSISVCIASGAMEGESAAGLDGVQYREIAAYEGGVNSFADNTTSGVTFG